MKISDLVPWRSEVPSRRGDDDRIINVRREMNRLFDDFFSDLERSPIEREPLGTFAPSLNLSETDEALEATLELPGMSEEDIDVTLTQDALTIKGEKKEEQEEEGKNYFRRERSYGYFRRTIPLPPGAVDQDKVDATFNKGVLKITLPKLPEAQSTMKRITVKSDR